MMAVQTSSNDSLQSGALAQMARWVDNAIVALSVVAVITALVVMFVALMAEVVVRYLTNQAWAGPPRCPISCSPGW